MKIKYYPCQPHCFAFGGFDMQMVNALESVVKLGVDASKMDIWSRDNDFDILHVWGIGPYNYQIIDWAKKSGKLIVVTVLLPYYGTLRSETGNIYRQFFSKAFKDQINYYKKTDRVVVVNDIQAKVLNKYYKVPFTKIDIIPNIVEQKYFQKPIANFSKKYDIENYVLCTGNISARKNQYNLALACVKLNLNLVLIGNVLDGEKSYANKLEHLISENKKVLWIKELPKASDDLVAAYDSCDLFALPSRDETQPISALEAVAVGKPIMLLNKRYALQSYYKNALLCKSPSENDIESALRGWLIEKVPVKQNIEIQNCTELKVGKMYKECYSKLTDFN